MLSRFIGIRGQRPVRVVVLIEIARIYRHGAYLNAACNCACGSIALAWFWLDSAAMICRKKSLDSDDGPNVDTVDGFAVREEDEAVAVAAPSPLDFPRFTNVQG